MECNVSKIHKRYLGLEEMTISYIISKQVDMDKNNNLYKTNKALDKISDKNMIDSIRQ
jgi:hypothetical protein